MSASSRPSSSNAFGRPRSQSRPRSRNDMSGGRDAEPQQQAQRVIDQGGDELDFCNAFWCSKEDILMARDNGTAHTGQTGYDALMNRMKNSGRMLDDFRAFYRERASIEEDYAKRMAKLARMPLGKDENGELGMLLKRLQYELDASGRCHAELATVIRTTLESRVKDFEASRDQRRKGVQGSIERSYKNIVGQEASVHKAMEKYKQDCILINSFSARLSLTQGKDLDRVTSKLDKAQQTVQVNEGEYKNYVRALRDTQNKWVDEWRGWADLCQDLEEERIDFARNSLWAYVNAVSLVCVKDDESCESVRQAVEASDAVRDLRNWVSRERGGSVIPDPPQFNDFSDGDKGFSAPELHEARFVRVTQRVEQAPFDSLERLQAAIYPQGGARDKQPSRQSTAQTPVNAVSEQSAYNTGRQSPAPAASARSASPTKAAYGQAGRGQDTQSKSRPSSRAASRNEMHGHEKEQTTAEKLQYQASQKRMSASAAKSPVSAIPPSPHYPYASASPRQAKPFDPSLAKAGDMEEPAPAPAPAPHANTEKKAEDPLLAALAKLRSPSSAVDVLPHNSPGVPAAPGTSGTYGRAAAHNAQHQANQSSYLTQPGQNAYASGMNGRRSPSQPIQGQAAAYARPPSSAGQYSQQSAGTIPRSATSPGPNSAYSGQPHTVNAGVFARNSMQGGAYNRPTTPVAPGYPGGQLTSPTHQQQRPPSQAGQYPGAYPVSNSGHQSIGPASMRSPSPAPMAVQHPGQSYQNMQAASGQPMYQQSPAPHPQQQQAYPLPSNGRQSAPYGSAPPPRQQQQPGPQVQRPTTPLGIALDASGGVAQDTLAERYPSPGPQRHIPNSQSLGRQSGQGYAVGGMPTEQGSSYQQGQGGTQHPQMGGARPGSFSIPQSGPPNAIKSPISPGPGPQHMPHSFSTPQQQSLHNQRPPSAYQQPDASQGYGQQGRSQSMGFHQQPYQPPPQQYHQSPAPVQQQQHPHMQRPAQQQQQRPPSQAGYGTPSQRGQPMQPSQSYQQVPQHPYPATPQQSFVHSQQPAQPQQAQRRPSAYGQPVAQQTPQTQQQQPPMSNGAAGTQGGPPTGQYTESGLPILFYVRAMYKYDASTPEEFSFQKDDVICVVATAEDGWWEGELLDPARAKASGNARTFPSNFTTHLD